MTGPCSVSGCPRAAKKKGMCDLHYGRSLKGRAIDAPIRTYAPGKKCSAACCESTTVANGLCGFHDGRRKRGKKFSDPLRRKYTAESTCAAPGCNRNGPLSDGFCRTHYSRARLGLDLSAPIRAAVLGRGRYLKPSGYIGVRVPLDTPGADADGVMFEHRFVMQTHLGRPLLRSESVHHKDGNKTNNSIDNLELRSGAHGRGIRVEDGALAHIAYLEQYAGLDLSDLAFLKRLRSKAEHGLLSLLDLEQREAPRKKTRTS